MIENVLYGVIVLAGFLVILLGIYDDVIVSRIDVLSAIVATTAICITLIGMAWLGISSWRTGDKVVHLLSVIAIGPCLLGVVLSVNILLRVIWGNT